MQRDIKGYAVRDVKQPSRQTQPPTCKDISETGSSLLRLLGRSGLNPHRGARKEVCEPCAAVTAGGLTSRPSGASCAESNMPQRLQKQQQWAPCSSAAPTARVAAAGAQASSANSGHLRTQAPGANGLHDLPLGRPQTSGDAATPGFELEGLLEASQPQQHTTGPLPSWHTRLREDRTRGMAHPAQTSQAHPSHQQPPFQQLELLPAQQPHGGLWSQLRVVNPLGRQPQLKPHSAQSHQNPSQGQRLQWRPPPQPQGRGSPLRRLEPDAEADGPLLVLGDSSKRRAAKRAGLDGKRMHQLRIVRARGENDRFNHWDDGGGDWDCDTLGIDGAEECDLRWEGVGTTAVGPRL